MATTLRNKIAGAADFGHLREAGIRLFELLTGKVWTDYNTHDPGVTILEACLYALTESSYKADQPVQNLLQDSGSSFVTAPLSLYNRPVTLNDLRKLLIDIYGISNSWFVEQDQPQPPLFIVPATGKINMTSGDLLAVKGLLDVYLELSSSELKILDPTLNFSDAELNGNILRSPTPASFPIIGGSENYFAEFAFPYWESFPLEWQSPIAIGSIVIAGGIPAGIVYNNTDDVFTASVNVNYNVTLSFSFGVIVKMTPFYAKTVPLATLQTFIGNLLSDITATGLIQRLNKKIVTITHSVRGVHETLEENRLLGTVYNSIDAARMQEIVVKADILVTETVDPEQLVTNLFLNIDRYLSPLPASYSEEELRGLGYTSDLIYNGPLLNNGFLLDKSLIPPSGDTVLFASDIIHAMTGDTQGDFSGDTYKILSFSFSACLNNYIIAGPSSNSLTLSNSERYRPRFSVLKSDIRLFREGSVKEIVYDKDKVVNDFMTGSVRSIKRIKLTHEKKVVLDHTGTISDNSYYSIQHDFPVAYGIGKGTISLSASADRMAKSRQLKAYLLFFEQILADQENQINNLPQILSLDPDLSSMAPSQPLYTIPDIAPLLVAYLGSGMSFEDFMNDPSNAYVTSIRNAMESPDLFFQRRNRFLDHLLARFGEDLSSYTTLMLSRLFTDPAQTIPGHMTTQWKILQDKLRLLTEIGTLEGDRGLGPDFKKFIVLNQFSPGQWRWEITDPDNNIVLLAGSNILANAPNCFNDLFSFIASIGKPACYVISAAAPFQVSFRLNPPAGSINAASPITFAVLADAQARVARIVELCSIIWNSENVSGLEKKVARQTGIPGYHLRNLVDLDPDDLFVFGFDGLQFNFSAVIDGFDKPLQSAVSFAAIATARTTADKVVKAANVPANYSSVITGPVVAIRISDISGVLATISVNNTPGINITKLVDQLVVFFSRKFGTQEGLYLVEHISLLPQANTINGILLETVFLSNPYLYQLSIIVPDGTDPGLLAAPLPARLTDTDFRVLLEKQVQQECPAHMFPFFIYPNPAGMSTFQGLYKQWRLWKHIVNNGLAALEPVQTNLVQWMNTSKPQYPAFIN
ncbi:MAG: hypothetical protein Q8941_10130 [Bacteroidota bacterium]|nr:hypothetical protein [Bacteroidota bacterium]